MKITLGSECGSKPDWIQLMNMQIAPIGHWDFEVTLFLGMWNWATVRKNKNCEFSDTFSMLTNWSAFPSTFETSKVMVLRTDVLKQNPNYCGKTV